MARLGQPFEAGGNIDAIAKDVAILDDDVTDIDADAQLDAVLGRRAGVAPGHFVLHFDGTAQCIHHAGELDQEPVAGGLDEAAAVLGEFRIEELAAQRFEAFESAAFVGADQPGVARHIGCEGSPPDGGSGSFRLTHRQAQAGFDQFLMLRTTEHFDERVPRVDPHGTKLVGCGSRLVEPA